MNDLSRAIRWPGYLAIALLLLIPIAVLTVRSGNWQQGLMLYALACAASALLLLWFRRKGWIGGGQRGRGGS